MMPGSTNRPGQPGLPWLQAMLDRLPPRWRKPVMWTGAALALAAAGWLLPTAMSGGGEAGANAGGALDSASLVASIIFKLGFVLLLVYGCLWLLRRWQGAAGRTQQRRLTLLESLRLTPKQALHVVRAGDQVLLIGATDQALTVLAEVHEELAAAPSESAAAVAGATAAARDSFGQLFSRFTLLPSAADSQPLPAEVARGSDGH